MIRRKCAEEEDTQNKHGQNKNATREKSTWKTNSRESGLSSRRERERVSRLFPRVRVSPANRTRPAHARASAPSEEKLPLLALSFSALALDRERERERAAACVLARSARAALPTVFRLAPFSSSAVSRPSLDLDSDAIEVRFGTRPRTALDRVSHDAGPFERNLVGNLKGTPGLRTLGRRSVRQCASTPP